MSSLSERIAEFLFGPKVRDCPRCEGIGRINHQCGMGACVDDPCPDCDERGYFFKNPRNGPVGISRSTTSCASLESA